jgi:hypothetical protein
MNLTLTEIFSLSILPAGILALIRCPTSAKGYLPFFLLLWVAGCNEILSIVLMHTGHDTVLNNNVYVLLESVLILGFFFQHSPLKKNKRLFIILLTSFVLFWCAENLIFNHINFLSSYYRVYYSFAVVLLSISTINFQIAEEMNSLVRNAVFLICFCFIISFSYKALVEIFYVYGLYASQSFLKHVYTIYLYLNLIVNLLFVPVVIWIPRKREYTLLLF